MALRSPALPARYRDARLAGRGGMADIYRATDAELGRPVAVKVLADRCAEDADLKERFMLEARAAARLSGDPHTVTIYDVGETQGRPYLVMEYLPGGSLAARLAAGRIDQALALEWLEQAAQALDVAHENGVVHRDVKPGNLLLDRDDNVYVADFGIARAAGVDSNTQTGVILGTAGYLAPEQTAGRRATAASDRYAFAVVAHELLAGTRPRPTPSTNLPPAAQQVFARALAEDPENRFTSCLEFVAALRTALAPAASTAPTGVMVRRRSRRTPLAIATALAFGLVAFVLTAALTTGNAAKPAPTVVQTVTVPTTRQGQAVVRRATPSTPAAASDQRPDKHHGKHHRRGPRREKGENDGEG
jgi:serine/threonine protein kinase